MFQLMFFDTQIPIRNRLGYVCIGYAAYCIGYARIEHAKVMVVHGFAYIDPINVVLLYV